MVREMLLYHTAGLKDSRLVMSRAQELAGLLADALPAGDELTSLRASLRVAAVRNPDRKSTRLNSSHANISYAVFCLKKNPDHSAPPTLLTRSPTRPAIPAKTHTSLSKQAT